MKNWLFVFCCFFLVSSGISQTTVKIQLIDQEKRIPVAGATIQVNDGSIFTSGATGIVELRFQKRSAYTIKINASGYQSIEKDILPDAATRVLTLELEQQSYFQEPVEIIAQRASIHAPFSKTNLHKEAIEKRNLGQDIPFILQYTPSVIVTSDAGNGIGYTGIRIRGSDASRINMTINGIPYNDAESQGIFFVNLPDLSSSVNSIQIQRGVGTSVNGAGAFGATMNFSTNEFNEKAYAEINNSVGSFNTWKNTVKVGSGLISKHFTVDARISRINSDGFIDRAATNLQSFYLSGAYVNTKTSVRLNIISGKEKTYQAWNGIPEAKLRNQSDALLTHYYNNIGSLYFTASDSVNLFSSAPRKLNVYTYDNQTDNYQQDHYQLLTNHAFNKSLSGNFTLFYSKGAGYYEQYRKNNRFSSYGLPNAVVNNSIVRRTDLIRQLWLDNDFYGGLYSLHYKSNKHQIITGGGYSEYRGNHFGEIIWAAIGIPKNYRWYDFDAVKNDANLYGKWEYQLTPELELFTDLQARFVRYNFTGTRKFPTVKVNEQFFFLNPKMGISYRRNGYNAYFSYAVGNKEPNRDDYERNSNEPLPKREQLHNIETGISKSGINASWNLNLFYMRYKDQLVLTGRINDVGDAVRVNVPNSFRLGLELEGKVRICPVLELEGNITWSRNRILNFTDAVPRYDDDFNLVSQDSTTFKNTPMSFSPQWIGSAAFNWKPLKGIQASLLTKAVGDQYLDNTGNEKRKINRYLVQDFQLISTVKQKIFKEASLIFQLNNIWNLQYEANGYTYSYIFANQTVTENFFFPMAGRNLMIALNIRL